MSKPSTGLFIKILPRLAIGFVLVFAYTLALFIFSVRGENALREALQNRSETASSTRIIHALTDAMDRARRHQLEYLMAPTAAERADLEHQLATDQALVQASLEGCEKLVGRSEDGADYEKISAKVQDYFRLQGQVLTLSQNGADPGEQTAAVKLAQGQLRQDFEALTDTASAWAKHIEASDARAFSQAEEDYRHSLHLLIACLCLAFAAAIGATVRIAGTVLRPLSGAIGLARDLARGDLTRRVDISGNDELCALIGTLNEMALRLSGLIRDVRYSAQTVSGSAAEMALSNEELSQRTQQQAARLGDTAASMEEITSLGRSNSSNAANADRLAQETRELAESGGSVVAEAVTAMSAINEGSAKISNIIGVIDDIAFQTNLLALNAAVEAARAGDQGRGFAVVASEVRALAQRSAEAAKQIKGLITDSADKVRTGTELVDRTGRSLAQIVRSVREMTGLIKEIANSSQEQALGVQRINEVILQLDGAMQENAVLVEEGTVASNGLREQAETLEHKTSFFTVELVEKTPTMSDAFTVTPPATDLRRGDSRHDGRAAAARTAARGR